MKHYKSIYTKHWIKLEEITLSDLADDQGASSFSLERQKQRGTANSGETKNTRLWECYLLPEGHVDFVFLAKGTKIYPDDAKFSVADSENNYELTPNETHTYIITLRVLDVKEWLNTYPEKTKITKKDLVDILDVSEIFVDSQVPAWYWQGGAYNLQQLDGTIYKKPIKKPKFWNKDKYHGDSNFFLDKITQRVINQYKFYAQQMAQMLTKKAQEKKWIKKS